MLSHFGYTNSSSSAEARKCRMQKTAWPIMRHQRATRKTTKQQTTKWEASHGQHCEFFWHLAQLKPMEIFMLILENLFPPFRKVDAANGKRFAFRETAEVAGKIAKPIPTTLASDARAS